MSSPPVESGISGSLRETAPEHPAPVAITSWSPPLRRRHARIVLLIAIGGVTLLGATWALVALDAHPGIDEQVFAAIGGHRGDLLARHAKLLATVAQLTLALASLLVLAFALLRRRLRAVVAVIGGYALAYGSSLAIKAIVQRPRPRGGLLHAEGFSFPSTDAAVSIGLVAVAVLLASLCRRRSQRTAVLLLGCAGPLAAGAAVIALRVHSLTDVLGGWGLGLACFAWCDAISFASGPIAQRRRGSSKPVHRA